MAYPNGGAPLDKITTSNWTHVVRVHRIYSRNLAACRLEVEYHYDSEAPLDWTVGHPSYAYRQTECDADPASLTQSLIDLICGRNCRVISGFYDMGGD